MISREGRREAENQIARLIHTYCYRLDAGDLQAVAGFFEDAAWHVSPAVACHGAAEKLAWLRQNTSAHEAYLGPQHFIGNILIDVADSGQTAGGMSYLLCRILRKARRFNWLREDATMIALLSATGNGISWSGTFT